MKKIKNIGTIILVAIWGGMLFYGMLYKIITFLDLVKCIFLFIVVGGILYLNGIIATYTLLKIGGLRHTASFFDMAIVIFSIGVCFNIYELCLQGLNIDVISSQTILSGMYMGIYLFSHFKHQKLREKWNKNR